ncbi:MAG: IS1182 family transposase, partial [Bacillota bacterium]|nr:IS1182 family transposase [Bacillota bacterium]
MKEEFNRNQAVITSLDELIDDNNPVRAIDAFAKSLDVEKLGYHTYSNNVGRPAYDTHELIGLYLYSYMNQVMSSRKLEK